MSFDLVFAPLIPLTLLWTLAGSAVALTLLFVLARSPAAAIRALAMAALLAVLANPVVLEEDREPVRDVAAIVVDRSASQSLGERDATTTRTLRQLEGALGGDQSLDVRIETVETARGQDGTALFEGLERALGDVPPERVAGAVFITDGLVHDVPETAARLGIDAPLHALITGRRDEADRRLTLEEAPRFGIVGESIDISFSVEDLGLPAERQPALIPVTVRVDGLLSDALTVRQGRTETVTVDLEHGGDTVVELTAEAGPEELTRQNNRAFVEINGVRDRLRVLLVSGEPHAGERTWRNLLKADPSVDLVHFTILRPPEKQDGTPIGELSLIAFPTRELFSLKLDEFDLIIFDRYRRRGVLPLIYLGNVARYVEQGGAVLSAAGAAFSGPYSLYRTPLAAILPAQPTGEVIEEGYKPAVTEAGTRHPVTAAIAPPSGEEPGWSRWFRLVDTDRLSGDVLMSGPDERPLLVLDHIGEGRVAQLLSDHAWLWARGFEGGGPHAELLRRLAHWLMKEPDLEEERLVLNAGPASLSIERRSMEPVEPQVEITYPTGRTGLVALDEISEGRFAAEIEAPELGLYEVRSGDLVSFAAVGPLNPVEFSDVIATEERLSPVLEESGGGIVWTAEDGPPDVRRVRAGRDASGEGWIGLRRKDAYIVRSVREASLLPPFAAMLLILAALMLGWRRESR